MMAFASEGMELESVMLCEVSQAPEVRGQMSFSYMWKLEQNEEVKRGFSRKQKRSAELKGIQREGGGEGKSGSER